MPGDVQPSSCERIHRGCPSWQLNFAGAGQGRPEDSDSARHASPKAALTVRPLRSHQRQLAGVISAIVAGQTDARDILAAITPGGGKSLLPVLAATRLVQAGLIDRICWVVPRDTLRLQAEEAFADPAWRATLGHALSVRAADNTLDPSRGLAGYVTTYQGVAAAPGLHLAEFQRHRTLLVVGQAARRVAGQAQAQDRRHRRSPLPPPRLLHGLHTVT